MRPQKLHNVTITKYMIDLLARGVQVLVVIHAAPTAIAAKDAALPMNVIGKIINPKPPLHETSAQYIGYSVLAGIKPIMKTTAAVPHPHVNATRLGTSRSLELNIAMLPKKTANSDMMMITDAGDRSEFSTWSQ